MLAHGQEQQPGSVPMKWLEHLQRGFIEVGPVRYDLAHMIGPLLMWPLPPPVVFRR